DITDEDIRSVVEVLRSDFLTQGPQVEKFEAALRATTGAGYAVAVANATAALHLSCLALGIGPGDEVWTSPNTFVASANCARYCGACVDFVDIDPRTYNLSVPALEKKLKSGRIPKALIPVHFAGQSCDMESVAALAKQYGFFVIEDASHAVGGKYKGRPIGSCDYSDLAVFSFHPVKIVTTGEGGAVLCNDHKLADRVALLRSHGITRDADLMTEPSHGPWYYQQMELGWNYRLTDIQAALGASQLRRLQAYIERRHELAERYDRLLADLPVSIPYRTREARSAFHLYAIRLELKKIKPTHRQVFESLRENGIGVQLHYIPVHLQPDYKRLGFRS
ncbi:MAG: UDP-4-amino-4,6-dideoxy-N-acetyl-beta-L-altrosamine transaminase, partial [Spirochaetia bacterium]|nr:UDP-4-amino-4,6-dideoxy-N-acetyl-beta-L-altrosamine transaminase [Spirochaetia bacterium]